MIKNEYSVEENIVTLHITRKNGDQFKVLMDLEDLHLLAENNYKVHVGWARNVKEYYAEIIHRFRNTDGKMKGKTISLQRLVVGNNVGKSLKIDHINHNRLDNRKCNLRITTSGNNSKNRKGKNSNNKSGYRNVSWINNKWHVQLQIDGKNTLLGKFDDVHEAGIFAKRMRKLYYGEFAGNG